MISARRAQLAALIQAGVEGVVVHDHVPEEVQPPAAIIQPSEPFVFEQPDDMTYAGELVISFDVVLLVPLDRETSNATAGEQLDKLGSALLRAVIPSGWWLARIGRPGALTTTSWIEHGMTVTVQTRFVP